MDREEFIKAIIENPEDESCLRLAYIEWLEEQGDPASIAYAEAERRFDEWVSRLPDGVQQAKNHDPESFYAIFSGDRLVVPEKWLGEEIDPTRIDEFLERNEVVVVPPPALSIGRRIVLYAFERPVIGLLWVVCTIVNGLEALVRLLAFSHKTPPIHMVSFEEQLAEFKNGMIDGDKVYSYTTPAWTWAALSGRHGLVLFRGGKPVKTLDTTLN
jgi:uncharacterized protein (TIGR02996 family)